MRYFFLSSIIFCFISLGVASEGPQFEGWYTRIVDQDNQRSIAVIGGSFLPKGKTFVAGTPLPGYLAVIISDGNGNPTYIYEKFPKETFFQSDGREVIGHPTYSLDSTYKWKAKEFGYISNDAIHIEIPGVIKINAEIEAFNPFPDGFSRPGNLLKLKEPIRWHVFSLGSNTTYQVEHFVGGHTHNYSGIGFAHQEKNWGMKFPEKWVWLQGISDDHNAQLALSGGYIKLFDLINLKAWTVGIKTKKINWFFKPITINNRIKAKIDFCNKSLKVVAISPLRKLVIKASASENTFGYVSIPTANGFRRNGGVESFSAFINVKIYERGLFSKFKLIEEIKFKNSAIEFGGRYASCN